MLDFSELRSLVRWATGRSQRSEFYRRLYALSSEESCRDLDSMDAWAKLPLLTKKDLLAMAPIDRSFVPPNEIVDIRVSSGTSGSVPLFSPFADIVARDEYLHHYHDFVGAYVVSSRLRVAPYWRDHIVRAVGHEVCFITFDPQHPMVCAQLALAVGATAFSTFAQHARIVGEAFRAVGLADAIRFIEVTGESCTRVLYDYLHKVFPNAIIVQTYGASEIEETFVGLPCMPMSERDPLSVYHVKSNHYLEILDPETGNVLRPEVGAEGELLVTAYPGSPSAFPMIRYRVGDRVRVVESRCEHGSWSFEVLGRSALDFIKIPGGLLRADEVERVLRALVDRVSDDFVLHRYERSTNTGPKTHVVLEVEAHEGVDLDALAYQISELLFVNATRTYARGVLDGLYLPLVCIPLGEKKSGKRRRMQHHGE